MTLARRLPLTLAALLALLAVGAPVGAQFSQFSWTLVGDSAGTGWLTADAMHVTGPDGGHCSGTPPGKTWWQTTSPSNATIHVHVVFDNQDTEIPWWHVEHPIFVRNGVSQTIGESSSFDFEGDFTFEVSAGDTFGFGIHSLDCIYGPGVIDLTEFQYVPDGWPQLAFALPGSGGLPAITGLGTLAAGNLFKIQLDGAQPGAPCWLVLGFSALMLPFKGGTLAPAPTPSGAILPFTVGGAGRVVIVANWPAGIPAGMTFWTQFWILDAGGPAGFAATNAMLEATQ